jgi:phospholipase C
MLKLKTAVCTAAALAAACAAGSVATAPHARAAGPIQHVVVLYLENHTFDNVLGFWCDVHPRRCTLANGADGGMPSSVRLSNGATVTPTVDPDTVPSVLHSVAAQLKAIDGGKMDGWQKVGGCGAPSYICVSGYRPSQIPNETALATKFAISDETFSMQDSPSWGGHLYAVAATEDGFWGNNPVCPSGKTCSAGWGCHSGKVTQYGSAGTMEPSCIPDYSLGLANGGAFEPTPASYVPTILDRLDGAGLPWRIYNSASHTGQALWAICPSYAECADTGQAKKWVPYSQFATGAANGTLPALSIITPGGTQGPDSQHNGNSMAAGDNWIGQVTSAVENSPEWSSTALFITYDDCGCFYDHVAPPLNSEGIREGPRSPLVIVSPYAKPGYTDTTPATFAGILAYTEHTFGLPALSSEDANAYDFSNAFNYSQVPLTPAKMVTRPLPASARHLSASADNDGT